MASQRVLLRVAMLAALLTAVSAGCKCGCAIKNPAGGCGVCKPCEVAAIQRAASQAVSTVSQAPAQIATAVSQAPAQVANAVSQSSGGSCKCGCLIRNPIGGGCLQCKPCELASAQNTAQSTVDQVNKAQRDAAKAVDDGKKALNKAEKDWNKAVAGAGAVVDEVKAAAADPKGYITEKVVDAASDWIGDQLAKALDVSNVCNAEAKKAAFSAGGWQAYYGKRAWDYKTGATLVGTLFPATSAAAVNVLLSELKAQYKSALQMLDQAADDAGEDLQAVMQQVVDEMMANAMSGQLSVPEVDKKTFGIKGTILHIACNNHAAGMKLPSEGYFQLAFAYRIIKPELAPLSEKAASPASLGRRGLPL